LFINGHYQTSAYGNTEAQRLSFSTDAVPPYQIQVSDIVQRICYVPFNDLFSFFFLLSSSLFSLLSSDIEWWNGNPQYRVPYGALGLGDNGLVLSFISFLSSVRV